MFSDRKIQQQLVKIQRLNCRNKKKLYFFQILKFVTIFQIQQNKTRDKFNNNKINIDKI